MIASLKHIWPPWTMASHPSHPIGDGGQNKHPSSDSLHQDHGGQATRRPPGPGGHSSAAFRQPQLGYGQRTALGVGGCSGGAANGRGAGSVGSGRLHRFGAALAMVQLTTRVRGSPVLESVGWLKKDAGWPDHGLA